MTGASRHYPLVPMRERMQWQLETAQQALAQAQRNCREARTALDALKSQQRDALRASDAGPDPVMSGVRLAFLARLHLQLDTAALELQAAERDQEACLASCAQLQSRSDELDSHFLKWTRARIAAQLHRQGVEADQAWLARRAWLGMEVGA